MTRTVKDVRLDTRAARSRLKPSKEPHWRTIDQACHIGYYRGPRGGTWLARRYLQARYVKASLGRADDILDADGLTVLSFSQAQAKARSWFAEQARLAEGLEAAQVGPYTVADAVRDYLASYGKRGKSVYTTTSVAKTHILPRLGAVEVAKLTPRRLRDWLTDVATGPARLRTRQGAVQNFRPPAEGQEAIRKRRATANRVLTVLKAALNHAWSEQKVSSDDAWRRVKPFHDVDAPVVRYLAEGECARLVNAAEPFFRRLIRAALLTGCRYGELIALRVQDFNADTGTVAIRVSKSGKPRHVVLADEGRQFFEASASGRAGTEILFVRANGEPWSASHQQRPLADACKNARISPAISFHILRHTHASLLAMKGVGLAVVAQQLGHSDTRMTERHYAHLAPSYVADAIRAGMPKLDIVGTPATVSITPRQRTRKQRLIPGSSGPVISPKKVLVG